MLRNILRAAVAAALTDLIGAADRAALLRRRNEITGFDVTFVNPYDEARELFWIGSNANEPVTMGTLEASGGAFNMNTYVGHTFGWKVAGGPEQCVADDMEDRVTVLEGMKRHVLGEEPQITDEAKAKLESERDDPFSCTFTNDSPRQMTLTDTADPARTTSLPSKASVQWDVKRGGLFDWTDGDELLYRSVIERYGQDRHRFREEQHTRLCAEATQPSTPVDVRQYHDTIDGREVEMHVLREDPFIVYLKNWTIGDECADMEAQATRIGLSAAQVFGEQSVIADRRAISANLNWNNRNASSVNNRLIERAFAFAAKQRGYAIQPGPFQEPLNFIQYAFGGEYRPHCDGVCQRRPYERGGRVATLIHYCKAAKTGGATVFPTAGLKVQPEDDSAILFAYKRDDGYMDAGNTLHTGCLLREGVKQIVTMWMREDVSDGEPWSDFLS
mmetsp:Transcript_12208/g.37609  ORF Transcript_12208/g.37609 Transcript_12208/m.37609 type:complete len:445 (+) Transcript_12208:142-1476(+)